VRSLLDEQYEARVVEQFTQWMQEDKEDERLERFHRLVAEFQFGRLYPAQLRSLLDALADEYDARYAVRDPLLLAEFLFQGYALRGVPEDDYYNPLNSNLIYVIEQRRGIPISLACIYILVGRRLDIRIEGCNMPGHFLAMFRKHRKNVYVDCYRAGTVLDVDTVRTMYSALTRRELATLQCNDFVIAARVLRNLAFAYEYHRQHRHARTVQRLYNLLADQTSRFTRQESDEAHLE
ncbi:MAG TPA: transglutaminase-like domain-containing protein, partial [Bacteroidota bacterium]|nr:transglutaminase-like domain-containing protein [Bacteroidota bacterium]